MKKKSLKICYGRDKDIPKINMEGLWLEKLGFHIGEKVNVEYDEGIIKITPVLENSMVAEPTSF